MDLAQLGPAVIVALIALIGGFLTARIQNKGKPENAMIDQLQEQIKDDREANKDAQARSDARITALEAEQVKAKRREHIRDNYINKLREHINLGNPPPPPAWPDGLYD